MIRKSEKGVARGEVIVHDSGREIVPTDNSAASWSYMLAFAEAKPSLADVRTCLERDEIPVAMVVDREMTARSRYKCSRVSTPNPNMLGWKVCHTQKVALGGKGPLHQRRLPDLETHFRNFLSPSNMFLVPLLLAGLGELPHFIDAIEREPNSL